MNFVILANAWSAAADNPTSKHQIALELARQGHRVLWIEGAGMRRPRLMSPRDRRRSIGKIKAALSGPVAVAGNIWKISPLVLPLPASPACRRFNEWLYGAAARRCAARLGFEAPVLVAFLPTAPGLLGAWRGVKVYYCVDRWDSFGTYDSGLMALLDAGCCRQADIVIASSQDLYERCRRHNSNTHLVTHGVDHRHFATALQLSGQRPADLPAGRIIGFFGLVSEWVDQDLLVRLARELPDAHVVLIGQADVPVDRLARERNIHLLGARPYAELPAYAAEFDVGIIPFVVNDLTRAVNPVKLREMLAAGCPVVSTGLPEVEEYKVSGVGFQVSGGREPRRNGRRKASASAPSPSLRATADKEGGRRKAEGGGQKSEVGSRKSEVRSRRAEVGSRRAEVGSQRSEPKGAAPVAVARDGDDFVRLVRECLAAPLAQEERRVISDSVKNETWEDKVHELLSLIA